MIDGIGAFVRETRESAGWSQEALSADAGVSLRTIQRLENDQPVAVETISAVARAFGLEADQLCNAAKWRNLLPTMEKLERVVKGHEIVSQIDGSHASFPCLFSDDDAVRDCASALMGLAADWNDVLDLDNRRMAERSLDEALQDLHCSGAKCFMKRMPMESEWMDREGYPIELDTVVFLVYPNDSPFIFEHDNGREYALAATTDTADIVTAEYG